MLLGSVVPTSCYFCTQYLDVCMKLIPPGSECLVVVHIYMDPAVYIMYDSDSRVSVYGTRMLTAMTDVPTPMTAVQTQLTVVQRSMTAVQTRMTVVLRTMTAVLITMTAVQSHIQTRLHSICEPVPKTSAQRSKKNIQEKNTQDHFSFRIPSQHSCSWCSPYRNAFDLN